MCPSNLRDTLFFEILEHMKKFIILVFSVVICSCNSKKQQTVAIVDGVPITMQQIDALINEQLFHMLEGIYLIRKQALDEYIDQWVIAEEAKRRNVTVDKLLEQVYLTVWMDGIMLKVKQNGKYVNKCVYIVIGLKNDGLKEVLGMWLAENESAAFWLSVLTDLKARGVEDILIACTDNLSGFTQAIKGAFPHAVTQLCIVHQIRNSCKFVVWKDRKEFCADLKCIYAAPTIDAAEKALVAMDLKWGTKYKYAIQSWQNNWENLTHFFNYPIEIRKIIYTTNTIENLNRGIRKYTKNKVQFVDDNAALKAVFLSIRNIEEKWSMPIQNWGIILHQFLTIFGNRCRLN